MDHHRQMMQSPGQPGSLVVGRPTRRRGLTADSAPVSPTTMRPDGG
jgi:hypothetical protein